MAETAANIMNVTDKPFVWTRPVAPGLHGTPGAPGVTALWRENLAFATLTVRRGQEAALALAAAREHAVSLPDGPFAAQGKGHQGKGFVCFGTGPGRWLACSEEATDLAGDLAATLGSTATVTAQDDAYVAFDLSGPCVPELLAKLVAIDLDPTVFPAGSVAVTSTAHMGLMLWKLDADRVRLLVGTSLAASFSRTLAASALEYGFRLEAGRGTGRG
ncbi:sarcosine oxidase subunit gamma [Ancylobacter sp. 6x-1]|uniref:Sarcosine oxidase subunit gamma n=1 Tax=Ancylobacter crimeensis TaxID=2579147 RepID=A0ABT0DFD2_9HYPH|nr:sarcosine oxidase subunit gamma [Ancylobacter crimeensis]MCK0198673.1 sarcosine oxidase subunit gamma [Ancylobacter crimeensis]